MIGLVSPRKINNLHLLIRCRRWTDKVPVGASVSGGFSPFSPTPPSLSKRKKVCTANSLLLLSGRLRREDLTSSDWDTWSPTTASSSQASCSSCSWSSSPQDLPLGHSMEWQMADVSSFSIFGSQTCFLFSLDPGVWAGQQFAEPALGRHHLPHRLWREAVRLQAADPTHALLPHPLCIQIPHHCHLLHIHEGKVWWLIFYFHPRCGRFLLLSCHWSSSTCGWRGGPTSFPQHHLSNTWFSAPLLEVST